MRHHGGSDQGGSDREEANQKSSQFPNAWAWRRNDRISQNAASASVTDSAAIGLKLLATPAKLGHVGLSRH
jgi:hypothetical protein